jgi:PmbA protein
MRTDRELSRSLIDQAIARGADLAEVYQHSVKGIAADVKDSSIESVDTVSSFGYGLRIIKDLRQGFSYANDPGEAKSVMENSFAAAFRSGKDSSFTLPAASEPGNVITFDPSVAGISESNAIQYASMIERGAKEKDGRINKIRKSSASFRSADVLIMNSLGVDREYSATTCSAQIMAVAEEEGEGQLGWGFSVGRFLDEVDFKGVGVDAARRAVLLLGAKSPPTIKAPILLEPMVAAEFLSVVVSMLSAESIQKGRSLLKGRVGEKIFHELVTIVDDGLMQNGPGRRPIDDEGVPVSMHAFIQEGVLTGYMHNSRTAFKDGAESTGNAIRGGFSSVPAVGPVNIFLKPGDENISTSELALSMDKGLHVFEAMGVHTIDPVSGDFSVGVSGLWIENGSPSHPVKEAVISGNLLDLFGAVAGIGSEMVFYGSIGAPSVLISSVDISG